MLTKIEIKEQIVEDWKGSPVKGICLSILDYLTGIDQQTATHLTYADFRKITDFKYTESMLLKGSNYLCSFSILKLKFEFIDDEDNVFDVDTSDIKEAKNDGFMTHPGNGIDEIRDYEKRIFYYFSPTELVRQL